MRVAHPVVDVAINPLAMRRPNLLAGRLLALHLLRPRIERGVSGDPSIVIKIAPLQPPGSPADATSTAMLLATAAIAELMGDPAALPGPVARRVMRRCNLELLTEERASKKEGQR